MADIADVLKERTRQFALKILDFVATLPPTPGATAIARQLTRAGLGVAGNYHSACRGRSHAEFTARLGIALDEADETELWLDIADRQNLGAVQLRPWLLDESRQLRAIFSKACATARAKERVTRRH